MRPRLIIIDGHSLAHRAFYALPLLTNGRGEYTNAVYGFAGMLIRLLEENSPSHIVVAFDTAKPTFRHERYDAYKAHRKKMPDEMRPQVGLIREFIETLGIASIELPGFEADDLIGTLAKRFSDCGVEVSIVTGDRDALQLVDESVSVMLTRKGISEIDVFTSDEVIAKLGVTPEQVPDIKGLMGDASDNIPGVPGVGEKTAVKLIREYGSVERLLANIDKLSGKLRTALEANVDIALLSKELATIDTSAPIETELGELVFVPPTASKLRPMLERLEFSSLIKRMDDGRLSFLAKTTEMSEQAEASSKESVGTGRVETGIDLVPHETVHGDDVDRLLSTIMKPGRYLVDAVVDGSAAHGRLSSLSIARLSDLGDIEGSILTFVSDASPQKGELENALLPFFSSRSAEKIMHDAKGLCTLLKRRGITLDGLIGDTMVAAYLLNSTARSYTLIDIMAAYLGMQGLSDQIDLDSSDAAAFRLTVIHKLVSVFSRKLREDGLSSLYADVEIPLISVLAEMESNGVMVDIAKLNELSVSLEIRAAELEKYAHELAGFTFNVNSTKQLADVLFVKLGLPPKKKTTTGFSTDVEVLEELAEEHELPACILEYRQVQKLKSTYADALAGLRDSSTGRIHTTFNQVATATGRLSSTDPNLQNIPVRTEEGRRIREVFIPGHEGWSLMAADYSQIELRVLADMSKDPILTESFANGEDIHTRTASEVFGVLPSEVTRIQRDQAKAVNFGIIYGQTGFGLSRGLGIGRKQAQEYIESYLGRYPGVKEYIKRIIDDACELGYVTTKMGRRRYIPDIHSRKWSTRQFAERTAMNTPIQGSAADIMKLAMVRVYRSLMEANLASRLLLQVHDELVLEVHAAEAEIVKHMLIKDMEKVMDLTIPLKVDVKLGSNWRDMVSIR